MRRIEMPYRCPTSALRTMSLGAIGLATAMVRAATIRAATIGAVTIGAVTIGFLTIGSGTCSAQSPEQVRRALHRSVRFFRERVSSHGGYVYQCSDDLSKREGEGKVGVDVAWIQPPGTPAVAMAYLDAYRMCGDSVLLEAAKETAGALIRGQLQSGGWDNSIAFDPKQRAKYAYRSDLETDEPPAKRRNTTTLDDDKSQSAARFLMQLDQELEFQDEVIHEAVTYALDCFLQAQYTNGAWPQRYSEFPRASNDPPEKASFDKDWPREFPGKNYSGFYTLNDNTMSDMIITMLDAWEIYGEKRYLDAAIRGGDFFRLAQLPEPQPGWAQQYDQRMRPAWARKFEPPAISGGESQGVMQTLIELYRRTADSSDDAARFLDPIPPALSYFRRSLLDDGRLARFYEMETNRPLFFTKEYELTYSPDDLPTHYAFMVSSRLDKIEAGLQKVRELSKEQLRRPKHVRVSPPSESVVMSIVEGLDRRGAWVERGRLKYHGDDDLTERVIRSDTFMRNVRLLAAWLRDDRPRSE